MIWHVKMMFFGVVLVLSQAAFAAEDVNGLLDRLDKALSPSASPPSSSKDLAASQAVSAPSRVEATSAPVEVLPLEQSPELSKILSIELQAIKQESEDRYPRSIAVIAGGIGELQSGLKLSKDDDDFVTQKAINVRGVELDLKHEWKTDFLSWGRFELLPAAGVSFGGYWGAGQSMRTGIESGVNDYKYGMFLGDIHLGLDLEWRNRIFLGAALGYGGSIINQQGDSVLTTTSGFFSYDSWEAVGGIRFSPRFDIRGKYRVQGVGVVSKTKTLENSTWLLGLGFQI